MSVHLCAAAENMLIMTGCFLQGPPYTVHVNVTLYIDCPLWHLPVLWNTYPTAPLPAHPAASKQQARCHHLNIPKQTGVNAQNSMRGVCV